MPSIFRTGFPVALTLFVAASSITAPLSIAAPQGASAPSSEMLAAEKLLGDGNVEGAIAAFERIVSSDPSNGVAQVRLGRALLAAGKFDRALEVEQKAAEIESVRSRALFNVACAFAGKKDSVRAFEALGRAADAGFTRGDIVRADPFLISLADPARLESIAERMEKSLDKPEYHQIDFWVGKWDVYNSKGQRVGSNIIEKVERGAVVEERWTNAAGRTGRSINYFNPGSGKMKQVWVDDSGSVLEMEGTFERGALRFVGTTYPRSGPAQDHRTTLTPLPNGRVRQFIQGGTGGNLVAGFDAIYVPAGTRPTAEELKVFEVPGDADR